MVLVTILATILLAGYWWTLYNTTTQQFAVPFINNHVPFNFYRNVLLPDIGMSVLIYLSYLFVNIFTISRLLSPQKFETGRLKISMSPKAKLSFQEIVRKALQKYLWLIIQILLITFLLGTALNVAIYYKHEWQFHYPGFSIFFNKNNPNSQIDIFSAYVAVLFIIFLYALYAGVREIVIHFIEISGSRRAYRTLICNQVTVFLVIYITLPFFAAVFHLVHEGGIIAAYFSFIIPVFLVFMSNTYWLFPLKGEDSILRSPIVVRLLLSTFLCTLPFVLSPFHEGFLFAFLTCWAIQLFIVTPLTWLFYQLRKDKILQLRGVEKALVKSKTDLQFLRSQINPHFLFNVLNTLYGTALQENAERTAGGIQKLGDMMRFMLHENNLDFIQMDREIEYLKNYISLQKLRTQSSPEISIEDNIDEQYCNHKIAPMLLIPFVENAFKHGISLKERSWIKINLNCNEKEILFEVRNSMHPPQDTNPEEESSGIGFNNVLERLKLIYPHKYQISVNGNGKEFFVQLAIQP